MQWLIWAAMLLAQNAAFTMVSRARNSSSIIYHGAASIFSNGIYFLNLFVGVDLIQKAENITTARGIITILFYTAFTTLGALMMHALLLRKEDGKMKVGGS